MTGEIETEQAGVTEACQTDRPYAIVINGKRRRFEIAPRVSNLWENAFATDSFNDDDLEYYERQKEYTEFVFVGEKRTLTVTATFPPAPGAVLKSITLPRTVDGERILGRMTFEGGLRPVIIVNGHWGATDRDDLLEIERVRRSREQIGGAGAGRPAVPGVSVRAVGEASAGDAGVQAPSERHEDEALRACRFKIIRRGKAVEYEGKPYVFTAPKQWEFLERLWAAQGAYVDCGKGLKRFFSRPQGADKFYRKAIEPKGEGCNGDGTYRLKI